MGIRGDHDFHALFLAHAEVDVFEVEAVGVGIALHGDAIFGAGVEDFLHVVGEFVAAEEQAAGGVADDLRVAIFDGGEHAVGHFGGLEIEIGMDGADGHVELREDFVGIIELAILEDVDFGADEHADAQAFGIGGAKIFDVLGHALVVETIRYGDGFGMVGDGDVFVAEGFGGGGHFFDGVFSIAGGGVHLEVALDVAEFDELGEFVFFGGFDFAGVFAQFGRDEVEAELGVNFFFGAAGYANAG